jgi:hypothetical protein
MHDQNISGDDFEGVEQTPEQEDSQWQARVLSLLLDHYPDQLSKLEIARELIGENPGFSQRDAFERALEDLLRVGLLQRCESLVLLTRPARHFANLKLDG